MDNMPKNDLGVDPEEWFEDGPSVGEYLPDNPTPPDWEDTAPSEYEPDFVNPLDSMPTATYKEDDWFVDKPEKKEDTMHEKMYKIATSRYNPFSVGGSENCDSDIDCNIQKHSPWPGGSENFQAKKKQEFTPENDPYGGY